MPKAQPSQPPCGSDAEHRHKHKSGEVGFRCTFAPGLEHGNRSNKEHDDRTNGNDLQKHVEPPRSRLTYCGEVPQRAVTGVTSLKEFRYIL